MTAVDLANVKTMLLGCERIVWISDGKQQELLLNTHHVWNAGINIDDTFCVHGGLQQIMIGDNIIPLDFVDMSTTSFAFRLPTSNELDTLVPIQILSQALDPMVRPIIQRKLAKDAKQDKLILVDLAAALPPPPAEHVVNPAAVWKLQLGFAPDKDIEKTL